MFQRLALATAGLLAAAAVSAQDGQWKEGTHYFRIDPPQATAHADKVEVTEVFSYGCPACSSAAAKISQLKAKLPANIVVDCSHANSWKNPEYQPLVMRDTINQIRDGNRSMVGLMVESFIEAGNQSIPADLSQLKYGCSVTDACVGWDTTAEMLRSARAVLQNVLPKRSRAA